MLSISPIADADYYLGGSGGACCVRSKSSPADYELGAVAQGEPPGRWAWRGENRLGLTGEIHAQGASGDAFRMLLNELRDPTRPKGEDGQHPRLGRAPQKFKTVDERVAVYERKHPHATPEEVAAFRMSAQADQRQANNAWDLVFSPPKSWSVLHAALQWAGRHDEAEALWKCFEAGVDAALTELHEHLAYIQSKPTGPTIGGRRTAQYEAAQNLQMATWRHHRSRDGDPQMHVHVTMFNRALDAKGRWRALYSPAILRSKHWLDALTLRVAEGEATRRLGYRYVATPDGVSREIEGVSQEVREFFSSRSRALTEEAQQLVDAFTAERGRAPSNRERWWMLQHATKATRRAKEKSPVPREEQLERWEEDLRGRTRASNADVLRLTDAARAVPGEEIVVPVFEPDAVIEQALAWLDKSKAVWSVSHLRAALDRHMPAMLAQTDKAALFRALVERAVAHPSVVAVAAKPAVPTPPSLMDAKRGQPETEAPDPRKFTTRATLDREGSLVARLDVLGAPAVMGDRARELVGDSGLSQEQGAVVVGTLTSGRWLEVIDAAAGTGKSTTGRALSAASAAAWGIGVTGFTVAENPARVLRGQGMDRAFNIAQFRVYREREKRGEVADWERARYAVAPGSYVWIDEASTVDTPTLEWLVAELYTLGVGKVLLVGDRQQADPVDAGGAFAMLVDELEHRHQQAARARAEQQAQYRAAHLALPPSQRAAQDAAMAAWTGEPAAAIPEECEPVLDAVPVHRLRQVRRFDQAWERAASARLREGDATVLHQYDTRGRLHGASNVEELREIAVSGFVTDWLDGHDSIIVTSTTEEASAAASLARQRLVAVGHVEREGVLLRDKTFAGIGDMIQTRLNDRSVGAVNRQRWQVVGRGDDGHLEVREELDRDAQGDGAWGPVHTLPAAYVAAEVELAYAGTVHAVEGTTISGSAEHRGTSWTIVTRSMGRSHTYVGATRATGENHLVVEVASHPPLERARAQVTALEHKHAVAVTPEQRASIERALVTARGEVAAALPHAETPIGRLAAVVAADDHLPSARAALAVEEDRVTHLGHLGPEWELLVRETRAAAHRQMLVDALGPVDAAVVLADPAVSRLYGLLRGAELSGHEPGEALEACAARGSLATARFPAAALYARLSDEMATGPLAKPVPLGFEARTPKPSRGDVENERLQHAASLGRVMDRRASELASQAAADQPEWAVRALGPVPDEPGPRARWIGNLAMACAYRERYGIGDDERTVLGRKPPHAEPERGWLWDTAARLIGVPEHERNLAVLSDGELANREQQWQRALSWMPRNVDADLRIAHTAAQEAQTQLVEARAAGLDPAAAQADVDEMASWVTSLEEIARVRADAIDVCAGVRDRALDAQRERERREEIEAARGGHLHPEDPGPEEPDEPEDELDDPEPTPAWSAVDAHEAVWEHLQRLAQHEPGAVPALGSWEWTDLDDADPAKWAAIEAAALAWWRVGEPPTAAEVRAENARLNDARAEIGVGDDVDADRMFAVARYVGPRSGPAPVFGSRAWAELAPDDPARARAVLDAALAEWNAGDVPLSRLTASADAAQEKVSAIRVSEEVKAQQASRGWDRRSEHQVQRDRALAEADVEREHGEPERAAAAEARAADVVERGEAQTQRIAEPVPEVAEQPEPVFDRSRYAETLAAARAAQDAAQEAEPEPAPAAVADPTPRNPVVDEDHATVADPDEAEADDVAVEEEDVAERRRAEREARDAEVAEQVAKARGAADVISAMRAREVEAELRAHEEEMQRSLELHAANEVEPEVEVDA